MTQCTTIDNPFLLYDAHTNTMSHEWVGTVLKLSPLPRLPPTQRFVACSLEVLQVTEAAHGQGPEIEVSAKLLSLVLSVPRVWYISGTFSEPHFAALYRKALNFIMSTTNRTSGRGVVVMSIDNLPAQLPREATDYFGSLLLPFIEDSVSLPRVHNRHLCGTTYVCGWRRWLSNLFSANDCLQKNFTIKAKLSLVFHVTTFL